MYQNECKEFDPQNPFQVEKQGTYEQWVEVDGQQRRFLVHIPQACRESAPGIFILPPNGWNADDLLTKTCWTWLAETVDKDKPILFFLEPLHERWQTEQPYGSNDDVAYVEAVFQQLSDRHLFDVHETAIYLYGCEEGGTVAQMAAMWNPAVYAGLCTINDTVAPAYMQAAACDYALNLCGYEDPDHRYDIKKGSIPLPAWMIYSGEAHDETVMYWKSCNQTNARMHYLTQDTVCYQRTIPVEYPVNQDIAAYTVWESRIANASEKAGDRLICRIWNNFLNTHRRWLADPGGDLRMNRDPVCDEGAEYHFEEVDGWLREWYTYVPDCVKEHPERPVPLVFGCHGYTCNGAIYMSNSGWHHIADENGFIVVFPTASFGQMCVENAYCSSDNLLLPAWNIFHKDTQPEEFPFFRYLIDRTAQDYAIDRSRVYVTGHSLGSLMVQMLGLAMPELFAAIAPCSGVLFSGMEQEPLSLPEVAARRDVDLPIWMFAGSEEEFLIPSRPEDGNRTAYSIEAWRKFNHLKPAAVKDWTEGWTVHDTRWEDLMYKRDGVPLVGFTRVEYMPHATMEEMSRRIWDEFFSHFARVEDRIVYHEGEMKQ